MLLFFVLCVACFVFVFCFGVLCVVCVLFVMFYIYILYCVFVRMCFVVFACDSVVVGCVVGSLLCLKLFGVSVVVFALG